MSGETVLQGLCGQTTSYMLMLYDIIDAGLLDLVDTE